MQPESSPGFRLSPQQERLIATVGESGVPMAVGWLECDRPISADALCAALGGLIGRHEILRTVFRKQRELKLPLQTILDASPVEIAEMDLSSDSSAEQKATLEREFEALSKTFTGAADPPVVRCKLFLLSDVRCAILLAMPSLCADAASFRVIAAELQEWLEGRAPDGELIQYADVTEWQHDLLDGTDEPAMAARAYWQDRLHTPLDLPLEGGGACAPDYRLTSIPIVVSEDALGALQAAAEHDANLLFAVWSLLLARVTGIQRIVSLVASECREYDEIKGAIGLFARYLPVAIHLEGSTSFEDYLRLATLEISQARNRQDWFQPGSSAEGFDIGFEVVDMRCESSLRLVAVHASVENLKLCLRVVCSSTAIALRLDFDARLYDFACMEELASSFSALLNQVTANPSALLTALSLVSSLQGVGLLSLGSGAVLGYPLVTVHGLISAQALRTPLALAVVGGGASLTYQELEARSNRLARYLGTLGVGPGSRVGLAVSRSPAMMVPLLAILKAGAAYVALAADQPRARIAQQLVGVKAVVTEAALQAQLPEMDGAVLVMDGEAQPWTEQPDHVLQETATPEDLAYVLYTSGSTGTPKGVAVRHRNLVNYATHIVRSLGLDTAPLAFATVSTLAADLGNTVLFPALLTGGTLHVLPYDIATDGRRMAEYCRAQPIDVLKIVPSHLAALLDGAGDEAGDLLPKRYLITGGEALKPALVERVLSHGSCQVINHYGPTETTVGSMMLPLEGFDWKQAQAATIPIGRPIANTRAYVLDASRNLVPIGVTGELYLAGAGVARGYLDQPERTAERFVPDPFAAGETMYRSGDLARWLPSGVVEFLGRADDQVKIRGFRVELGEIEAALLALAGVRQAVVLMRPKHDDQQLVAYVVLDRQQPGSSEALREALKLSLPDYMVPAAIVPLPRLPLTANGKLDRAALPEPEERATRKYIAPTTPTEQLVQQIWQDVLKLQQISTDENFFDLGGHSLLATQVVSRLRRVLNVDLPLRAMFDAPTVARIASRIDAVRLAGTDPMPAMSRADRAKALPLSFAQQRLWILDQLEPGNPMYNIPRSMRMRGLLDVDALTRSLNEIVRRHEPLRTRFATVGGEPVQQIELEVELRVVCVDLSATAAEEREAQALEVVAREAATPFDLAVAPLIRAVLVKLADDDHVLILNMHHIVSDAWSATVFRQELAALYEAFLARKASPLPELSLQYADYASWQRDWLQGAMLARQLAFWRDQLAAAPPLLVLPTDRPRPSRQTFAGAMLRSVLPEATCDAVKTLCREEGVTVFMALLAAYQMLLARLSGLDRIVVGTDSANRFSVETECMIGFFINLLPLSLDLSGDPAFRDLLARTREMTLDCYAHQEMPFDKIVEELRPDRTGSHNPIVQVLFVMQNTPTAATRLGGLELSGFHAPLTRSKFDIALFAVERPSTVDLHWVYSKELFDEATVAGMAESFATLVAGAAANPATRIGAIEWLTDAQKQKQRDDRLGRKLSTKAKLMSAGPKAVMLDDEEGA